MFILAFIFDVNLELGFFEALSSKMTSVLLVGATVIVNGSSKLGMVTLS